MTESNAPTNNTVGHESTVGIQAEQVSNSPVYQYSTVYHDSTVYHVPPDALPDQKYEIGVRFLENGVPGRARNLIREAIAGGHDNSEVRFHWVLALLSKRSYRDLTFEEREELGQIADRLHEYNDDEWKYALEVICELLSGLKGGGDGLEVALEKLRSLPSRQYNKIVRHLDLVLTGGIKDTLWAKTRQKATRDRFGKDRLTRVWAYFHPDPAPPYARRPADKMITVGDWFWSVACSTLLLTAVGKLGWSIFRNAEPLSALAYLFAIFAGYIGVRNGLEWRYRLERLEVKERVFINRRNDGDVPKSGFANRVNNSCAYYFFKYAPKGVDRDAWLARTVGIRKTVCDEIVEIYQESKTSASEINWLIRFIARQVAKQWSNGTFYKYRERYYVAPSVKVCCLLALAVFVPAATSVVLAAMRSDPFAAWIATLVALFSGRVATLRWFHIISERRRYVEDQREHDWYSVERWDEYRRWKKKLDSTRPLEREMESWLDCDKTILLDMALRYYKIAWRDIIAHAFLQTPAKNCKRARRSDGPWRYSRYDLQLFLITQDGVREIGSELDFEKGIFRGQERNSFRFDAVSSIRVTEVGEFGCSLELTLMNGPAKIIKVVDQQESTDDSNEKSVTFSDADLDAAGFAHTLHILEGIAAEGKGWIKRDPLCQSRLRRAGVDSQEHPARVSRRWSTLRSYDNSNYRYPKIASKFATRQRKDALE